MVGDGQVLALFWNCRRPVNLGKWAQLKAGCAGNTWPKNDDYLGVELKKSFFLYE